MKYKYPSVGPKRICPPWPDVNGRPIVRIRLTSYGLADVACKKYTKLCQGSSLPYKFELNFKEPDKYYKTDKSHFIQKNTSFCTIEGVDDELLAVNSAMTL